MKKEDRLFWVVVGPCLGLTILSVLGIFLSILLLYIGAVMPWRIWLACWGCLWASIVILPIFVLAWWLMARPHPTPFSSRSTMDKFLALLGWLCVVVVWVEASANLLYLVTTKIYIFSPISRTLNHNPQALFYPLVIALVLFVVFQPRMGSKKNHA